MRRTTLRSLLAPAALLAFCFAIAPTAPAFANATITIFNNDGAGEGFNDPTPVAPVGGNPGTTLGQQRLIAFQAAADIWGMTLDSAVPIVIRANFDPLNCNATQAVLGSAGTLFIFANFGSIPPHPGAAFPDTWHSSALADKRAGAELNPGAPDISARFNVNLGNVGCLTGIGWYLGLDNNHGSQIDLVTVLLHEFGHGLGFQQFASLTNGSQFPPAPGQPGFTDTYGRNLFDTTISKTWDQMTNAERVTSAVNSRRVVWDGDTVTGEVPSVLAPGFPNLRVDFPGSIAGNYAVGTASFGPALTASGASGAIVQALDPGDANGPLTTDGCSPLTNAAAIAGNLALVDRGTCAFTQKAKNAQNAGAVGVVVVNNAVGAPPPGLGGADPTVVIPAVMITQADGNIIKAQLGGGVSGSMLVDLTLRAGADGSGRAMMNAPNPVQGGSSISHWDPVTFPNQLMEPAINSDLNHQLSVVDLTLGLMRDIGWFPDADVEGIADADDNCPNDANADQADNDADNLGDVCDADDDNDGVADGGDNCPFTANTDQVDFDLDHIGDACDPETGPPVNKNQCKNGNYARFDVPTHFSNEGVCVCYVETGSLGSGGCTNRRMLGP